MSDIIPVSRRQLARVGLEALPTVIANAGENAAQRFIEFFTATIRNKNTRLAYARACADFFNWCQDGCTPQGTLNAGAISVERCYYERGGKCP